MDRHHTKTNTANGHTTLRWHKVTKKLNNFQSQEPQVYPMQSPAPKFMKGFGEIPSSI